MYYEASLAEKARKFSRLVLGRPAFPPKDVTIEVTTRCGRGCAVCFRGPLGVGQADMPRGLYLKALGALREAYGGGSPRYLNFVGLGEPFCHPGLPEFLRLAAAELPGAELNLSTGLAPFDRAAFEALVADGVLNRLSVSLDSAEPGGAFHGFTPEVKGNYDFLRGLKERRPGLKLRVQTLLTGRAAVLDSVRLAAELGAGELQLLRVDLHAFGANPPAPRPGYSEERAVAREAAALASSLGLTCRSNNDYDLFMDLASRFDRRCLISDDHIFITAGGDVLPCFYLRGARFGNLAAEPLAAMTAARAAFFGRQRELCRGCDIYRKRHSGEGS